MKKQPMFKEKLKRHFFLKKAVAEDFSTKTADPLIPGRCALADLFQLIPKHPSPPSNTLTMRKDFSLYI